MMMSNSEGLCVDDRKNKWDDYKLNAESISEYIPSGSEYKEIYYHLENSSESGRLPHVRVYGPTGSGKTLMSLNMAIDLADNEASLPFFSITFTHGTKPKDLIGHPSIQDGNTEFKDGTLTKAIRASKDGPIFLLLDEVNRARPEVKDSLYEFLDHRGQISLEGFGGGEVLKGVSNNLIVFSTMNKGQGHLVERIDYSERRRLGPAWETGYLGYNPDSPDNTQSKEVELISKKTPASRETSREILRVGNEIRELSESDSEIKYGAPTSVLVSWARTAYTFNKNGLNNPVYKAGMAELVRGFYDGDKTQMKAVKNILKAYVYEMKFLESDSETDSSPTDINYS